MASYKIAVSGAARVDHCCTGKEKLSEKVGREIAKNKCITVTGATTGAPYYAAKGAKKEKGISIGFSPASTEREHKNSYRLPTDAFDMIVYTGFEYAGRNLLMTRAADALIVICGRMGTLNEFTIAFEDQKPIGVLIGSGGTADNIQQVIQKPYRGKVEMVYERDPKVLVEKLIKLIKKDKKK